MSEFDIAREVHGSKGRYVIRRGDDQAELTYSILSSSRVIADHTGVPDAMRGTGAGAALIAALVADARSEKFTIVPLCSFVDAQRRRHPDWADAFDV